MHQPYPEADHGRLDPAATEEMRWVMAVITAVRTLRAERDLAPSRPLAVLLADGSAREHEWMQRHERYLRTLARTESLTWLASGAQVPESAMQLVGALKVLVPLGSLIDRAAELARIAREIDKTEKELAKARAKLANPEFVARAPRAVVEQEQARVRDFETALAKLAAQRAQVEALPG
jgi:valyl-tRNA synthetase